MTRLVLLCGSQRRQSLNARLLDEVTRQLPQGMTVDRLQPADIDLPLFNQDLEHDPMVIARVTALHQRIAAAQAFIIASPEYNGLPTPYFKNIVDWVSRLPHILPDCESAFADRPLLLCSASTGWSGGSVAIPSHRALFGYVGAICYGETLCLPHAGETWDEEGQLQNQGFGFQTWQLVGRFCAFAARLAPIDTASELAA